MDNRSLHDSIGADSEEAILVGVAAGVHPFVLPGDEVRAAFDMNDSDRAFGQNQGQAGRKAFRQNFECGNAQPNYGLAR